MSLRRSTLQKRNKAIQDIQKESISLFLVFDLEDLG